MAAIYHVKNKQMEDIQWQKLKQKTESTGNNGEAGAGYQITSVPTW